LGKEGAYYWNSFPQDTFADCWLVREIVWDLSGTCRNLAGLIGTAQDFSEPFGTWWNFLVFLGSKVFHALVVRVEVIWLLHLMFAFASFHPFGSYFPPPQSAICAGVYLRTLQQGLQVL